MNDITEVRCNACGASQQVSFARCLSSGWPLCCGETMALVGVTPARVVESAMAKVLRPLKALRKAMR